MSLLCVSNSVGNTWANSAIQVLHMNRVDGAINILVNTLIIVLINTLMNTLVNARLSSPSSTISTLLNTFAKPWINAFANTYKCTYPRILQQMHRHTQLDSLNKHKHCLSFWNKALVVNTFVNVLIIGKSDHLHGQTFAHTPSASGGLQCQTLACSILSSSTQPLVSKS